MRTALIPVALAALLATGCGRLGFDLFFSDGGPTDGGGADVGPLADGAVTGPLVVVPAFGPGAVAWNDYLAADLGPFTSSGAPCVGAGTRRFDECVHAAERLRVVIDTPIDCVEMVATDDLDAFEWVCLSSGGSPEFVSLGLKRGRGLADLLNAAGTGWETNALTVRDRAGAVVGRSTSRADWFSNPIVPLLDVYTPPGTFALDRTGAVYTLTTRVTTDGVAFAADGVALVTLPGGELVHSGTTASACDDDSGAAAGADGSELVCIGDRRFVWVEGRLFAAGTDAALRLVSTRASRIHRVRTQGGDVAVDVGGAASNLFTELRIGSATTHGLSLDRGAARNTFHDVMVGHAGRDCLRMNVATDNVFQAITVANCGDPGRGFTIDDANATRNTFVEVVSMAAGEGISTGVGNVYSFVTIINSGMGLGEGMWFNGTTNTVSQLLVGNVARDIAPPPGSAVSVNTSDNRIVQVAAAHAPRAIDIRGDDNELGPRIWVGDWAAPTPCRDAGSRNQIDDTCAYGAPAMAPATTALDLSGTFVGAATDDSVAPSGAAGAFASITDWVSFENRYRGYGRDDPARFPAAGHIGVCDPGDTCRIWDVTLRIGGPLHGVNGAAACSGAADASNPGAVVTERGTPNQVYLVNAFERFGDLVGDEDGLCETGEDCVFGPNIGAYQGHGELGRIAPNCRGGNGVTGYSIWTYLDNGV